MHPLEKVYRNIDENIESHVKRLQEFVRQPSISQTGEGVKECAELLKGYLKELGCKETRLVPQTYSPVVYAEYDAGAEKTVIIYMSVRLLLIVYDPMRQKRMISEKRIP